jgi:hypothetical protein
MKLLSILVAATAVSLTGCSSFPGSGAKQSDEHDAHHPATDSASKVDQAKVDQQMRTMQEMHQKMMVAKTPADRTALMKDHMKTMQDGMAMMGQMGGMPMQDGGKFSMSGAPPMHKDMMQRMEMMELMMQMMVDREAASSPAAR